MSCVLVVDTQMGTSLTQYKEPPQCRKFLEKSYSTGQESICLQFDVQVNAQRDKFL